MYKVMAENVSKHFNGKKLGTSWFVLVSRPQKTLSDVSTCHTGVYVNKNGISITFARLKAEIVSNGLKLRLMSHLSLHFENRGFLFFGNVPQFFIRNISISTGCLFLPKKTFLTDLRHFQLIMDNLGTLFLNFCLIVKIGVFGATLLILGAITKKFLSLLKMITLVNFLQVFRFGPLKVKRSLFF